MDDVQLTAAVTAVASGARPSVPNAKDIRLPDVAGSVRRLRQRVSSSVEHRHKEKETDDRREKLEEVPLVYALMAYMSYIFLVVTGYMRELIWGIGPIDSTFGREFNRDGYAPLYSSFEGFYTRNIFRRYKPVVGPPMASVPGGRVMLKTRETKDHYWTSTVVDSPKWDCINLGSYNYLGYAENSGPCTDAATESIAVEGITNCSPRQEMGNLPVHALLERTIAEFIGAEDAIAFGMGFATNTLNLPRLLSKGCLVLSDELNHASLILGMRLSGATVKVFKHDNVVQLEKILRQSLLSGHPRTRRPWKKVFIVVEGVYSMEGTICKLPEIVAVKKKYGAYLYLDEAHSVGAMGPNGRGVVDYYGLNPKDIDIMMGTFTKSFGAAGGYIAGSSRLISYLRVHSQGACYATSVSPPVAMQVVASMRQILGVNEDGSPVARVEGVLSGQERIRRLADNARYFRQRLKQMGLIVYGDNDSPVIPMLLVMPAKIRAFPEVMKEEFGIATVTVGFPAVPMTKERARFCMSSSHDKTMLDQTLDAIEKMADLIQLRYSRIPRDPNRKIVYGSRDSR